MTGIYYFSGTGNCLAIAKQLKEKFENTEIIRITHDFAREKRLIAEKNTIIIYPSYAYGMPRPMYDFLKNSRIESGYIAAVVSYGSTFGASLAHAKRLLKKHSRNADYYAGIASPENYLPLFGIKSEEEIENLLKRQQAQTEKLAESLIKNDKNDIKTFKPFSDFVSFIFLAATPFINRGFKITDACTGCGVCEKVCPTKAVKLSNEKKPLFDRRLCAHCQACINFCPVRAVMFPGLKKLDRRYRHPGITLSELSGQPFSPEFQPLETAEFIENEELSFL